MLEQSRKVSGLALLLSISQIGMIYLSTMMLGQSSQIAHVGLGLAPLIGMLILNRDSDKRLAWNILTEFLCFSPIIAMQSVLNSPFSWVFFLVNYYLLWVYALVCRPRKLG